MSTTDATYWVATGESGRCLHTRRDCFGLSSAIATEPADTADRTTHRPCPFCMQPREPPPDPAPATIPCPCGGGDARKLNHAVSEPYSGNGKKRAVHHRYRHTGCPIGGVIVVVDGDLHRREGPLFYPERYGFEAVV